eukprot:GHVU01219495.1.p1 GENE.GHVU01219495.1~~GHVU01219495.1.p1  ORF type:complete len:293 (+),score=54.91 GHVU01219495.1:62-880(+)
MTDKEEEEEEEVVMPGKRSRRRSHEGAVTEVEGVEEAAATAGLSAAAAAEAERRSARMIRRAAAAQVAELEATEKSLSMEELRLEKEPVREGIIVERVYDALKESGALFETQFRVCPSQATEGKCEFDTAEWRQMDATWLVTLLSALGLEVDWLQHPEHTLDEELIRDVTFHETLLRNHLTIVRYGTGPYKRASGIRVKETDGWRIKMLCALMRHLLREQQDLVERDPNGSSLRTVFLGYDDFGDVSPIFNIVKDADGRPELDVNTAVIPDA